MKTLVLMLLFAVSCSPGVFAQKANKKADQKVQEHDITAWLKEKDRKKELKIGVNEAKVCAPCGCCVRFELNADGQIVGWRKTGPAGSNALPLPNPGKGKCIVACSSYCWVVYDCTFRARYVR